MPGVPTDIYVAVGSNIAPERNVPAAIERLGRAAESIAVSTFYRTRPLTRPDQDDFRNGVVRLRGRMERETLERDLLKKIESDLGRVRTEDKHAARPIDLDVAILCEDGATVWADDDVMRRNFIATPLAELAPALRLPNGATAAENAQTLGMAGLDPDIALTRIVKRLECP